MRSFLGVPIFVRDVVYGDLYLADKEGGEFTQADEEIVTLLAAQTAITIERTRTHQAVVHWVCQLEALNELTLGVLEERDVSAFSTWSTGRQRGAFGVEARRGPGAREGRAHRFARGAGTRLTVEIPLPTPPSAVTIV